MNGAYYDPQTGLFSGRYAGGPTLEWIRQNAPDGAAVWVYDTERPDPLRYRIEKGALVEYQPPKPTDTADVLYVWDADAWRWAPTPSLAVRQAQVCVQIEAERDRQSYMPILFEGVVFQADAESRGLISGTLARILRGDGLPGPWIGWRDVSNEMHWADLSADAVRIKLAGLSTAIEDRESALRIATWQRKAAVRALTDVAAVDGFDVTAGWPDDPEQRAGTP